MPTSHIVLCCCKCLMFQVHQTRKSNKWICKVCSTKQSILKIYAEASAADCRSIVQKLNKECAEHMPTHDSNQLCDLAVSDKAPVSVRHFDVGSSGFVHQHSDRFPFMENTHQYTHSFRSDHLLTTPDFTNESEYKLGAVHPRTVLGDLKQASNESRLDLLSSESDSDERVHFENSKSKWDVYL
ncbi:hypothetical protein P879_05637 [Paragonimus westermani]|uniref:MRN complex-interacting protein N-terminal domain-containing protein n=1 Tax=Paragonimus westermani TaxID=34504 RepID=A0A8T0D596_9TREM|nr:hypothetical protein P879_05637 [Paragonimus westermani]